MSTHTTPDTERELATVMRAAARAGVAVCLWGEPGVGKSSVVRAAAEADGAHLEVVIGSIREPADFNGLPVVTDQGVRMAPPAWAVRLREAGGGYLFLDELTTAPPAVQAAMLQVVLERTAGEIRLPDSVAVIAAANPPEIAADGWDLAPPMANRFLHLDFAPRLEDWIEGLIAGFAPKAPGYVAEPDAGAAQVMRSLVASFLRTRPDLDQKCPRDGSTAGRAWPSRRTWTMAADVLALLDPLDTGACLTAAAGLVGEGAAAEFMTWRALGDLPHPADVIEHPDSVSWLDTEPSRTFAILAAVVSHTTALGTQAAWRAGWAPLAAAAKAGRADVAAMQARALMRARPGAAKPPAIVREFAPVLTAAGLMPEGSN